MRRPFRAFAPLLLGAALLAASPAAAQPLVPAARMPGPLKEVGFDQRLGAQVPLGLPFRDEAGRAVRLGDYFGSPERQGRPVVLVLAYYDCPMLCGVVLGSLAASLKALTFDAGREFEVVVVSFDPSETPALAAAAKREALERYGRPATAAGWHFLTGGEAAIGPLARAVGFRYHYVPETREFAHAAGLVVLTPQGRIARYFYGVEYPPRDVRLGLVEAAGGKIGSVVDQVLLFCFHYDPAIGKYSAVVLNIVRLGGAATVLGLLLTVVLLRRRESPSLETA